MNEDVFASASGVVTKVAHNKGYGNYLIIKHDENYSSLYSQLSKILVDENQKVEIGEVIGKVGSSGLSTNPHLHFEVIKDGKKVDPMDYIKA